jgi:hypothetical protein
LSFGWDAMWLSVVIQYDHYGDFCTLSHPVLFGSAVGSLELFIFIICILRTTKTVVQ